MLVLIQRSASVNRQMRWLFQSYKNREIAAHFKSICQEKRVFIYI